MAVATPRSLGAGGVVESGVRHLGAPRGVRVAVRRILPSDPLDPAAVGALLDALATELGRARASLLPGRHALLCLADVQYLDAELLGAVLGAVASGLPVVGGTFEGGVAVDGQTIAGAAVVVLIEAASFVTPLLAHPFALTEARAVVTACDRGGRRITELDGWPAAERFAQLAGLAASALDGARREVTSRLDVQLAWVLGGHAVLRPVVGRDGPALTLGAAVQRGAVLRLTQRSADVPAALIAGVGRALAAMPDVPETVWAFGCGAFFDGDAGRVLGDQLATLGVVACAVEAAYHGPTLSCGTVSGLAIGASPDA